MSNNSVKEEPKDAEDPSDPTPSLNKKVLMAVIPMMLYLFLLISTKIVYDQQQHMDKLDDLVLKAEGKMHNLHLVDRGLAVQLERIENTVYDEDYDMTTTEYVY